MAIPMFSVGMVPSFSSNMNNAGGTAGVVGQPQKGGTITATSLKPGYLDQAGAQVAESITSAKQAALDQKARLESYIKHLYSLRELAKMAAKSQASRGANGQQNPLSVYNAMNDLAKQAGIPIDAEIAKALQAGNSIENTLNSLMQQAGQIYGQLGSVMEHYSPATSGGGGGGGMITAGGQLRNKGGSGDGGGTYTDISGNVYTKRGGKQISGTNPKESWWSEQMAKGENTPSWQNLTDQGLSAPGMPPLGKPNTWANPRAAVASGGAAPTQFDTSLTYDQNQGNSYGSIWGNPTANQGGSFDSFWSGTYSPTTNQGDLSQQFSGGGGGIDWNQFTDNLNAIGGMAGGLPGYANLNAPAPTMPNVYGSGGFVPTPEETSFSGGDYTLPSQPISGWSSYPSSNNFSSSSGWGEDRAIPGYENTSSGSSGGGFNNSLSNAWNSFSGFLGW